MSDTLQVVIVTVVALAALLVLLRPLVARGKPRSKAGGCANCAATPPPARPRRG
jgi:hypothetical protein